MLTTLILDTLADENTIKAIVLSLLITEKAKCSKHLTTPEKPPVVLLAPLNAPPVLRPVGVREARQRVRAGFLPKCGFPQEAMVGGGGGGVVASLLIGPSSRLPLLPPPLSRARIIERVDVILQADESLELRAAPSDGVQVYRP